MKRADAEDGALAVGAVLVGQSDVWFPLLSAPNVVGPPALVAAAYAVCAASLTLRRRTPFAVLCVVVGVTTGMALVFGRRRVQAACCRRWWPCTPSPRTAVVGTPSWPPGCRWPWSSSAS